MVEAYRLHPNAIKAVARSGQGYLLSDSGLHPVAYGMLPPLTADYPLLRKDQRTARGLSLYETFVAHRPGEQSARPRQELRLE
jgi:hypothetical protein